MLKLPPGKIYIPGKGWRVFSLQRYQQLADPKTTWVFG